MYGWTLAVTHTGEDSTLTFGVLGRNGTGYAAGLAFTDQGIVDIRAPAEQWAITLLVAGSTSFGADDDQEKKEPARQEKPAEPTPTEEASEQP